MQEFKGELSAEDGTSIAPVEGEYDTRTERHLTHYEGAFRVTLLVTTPLVMRDDLILDIDGGPKLKIMVSGLKATSDDTHGIAMFRSQRAPLRK